MTVCLVISLPKIPYVHCIYRVLANPTHMYLCKDEMSVELRAVWQSRCTEHVVLHLVHHYLQCENNVRAI